MHQDKSVLTSALGTAQIWENYKLQSGEGVSFWFILIWCVFSPLRVPGEIEDGADGCDGRLVGDLTNFAGSYRQGLLPTMMCVPLAPRSSPFPFPSYSPPCAEPC